MKLMSDKNIFNKGNKSKEIVGRNPNLVLSSTGNLEKSLLLMVIHTTGTVG